MEHQYVVIVVGTSVPPVFFENRTAAETYIKQMRKKYAGDTYLLYRLDLVKTIEG